MGAIAGAVYGSVHALGIPGGVARTPAGELYVMGLAAATAPPAGTLYHNGYAIHPDGYLYVVWA